MKKIVLATITTLLFAMGCADKKKESQTDIPTIPVNDLPAMPITLLDGSGINARQLTAKIILVLFQPDCDHCQHEAEAMRENLEAFKSYTLYFISSASRSEIEKFSVDYKLSGLPNVFFGNTSTESILNNFGPIQAPSLYIYRDQKLIQAFNGQTDISVIIKYL